MYYVLYDKDFNALGTKKVYPCSSWSWKRKAYEFDELVIEGVASENSDSAMYVGLHDEYMRADQMSAERGTLKALAFCGLPETKNGITKVNAVDIRQLLNNECIIDLTEVETVRDIYDELLNCQFSGTYAQTNLGITVEEANTVEADEIVFKADTLEATKAPGNVWDILQAVNAIYDCYIDTRIDFVLKKIQFVVKQINNSMSINLNDFGLTKIKRDTTKTNRAVCYKTDLTTSETYYLQTDDTVVTVGSVDSDKIIYPMHVKYFTDDDVVKAKTNGMKELYKNRFAANVEIPLENENRSLLNDVDLTYKLDIYGYKTLPVMEISENSSGVRKIKAGRLEAYWWV